MQEFGFVHLSAGDLLRQERDSGSENGDLIESCMKNGLIVPVEITIALLGKAMERIGAKKFLIDGFPRNEDNLDGWEREMTEDKCDVKCVLFFDCPEEVRDHTLAHTYAHVQTHPHTHPLLKVGREMNIGYIFPLGTVFDPKMKNVI